VSECGSANKLQNTRLGLFISFVTKKKTAKQKMFHLHTKTTRRLVSSRTRRQIQQVSSASNTNFYNFVKFENSASAAYVTTARATIPQNNLSYVTGATSPPLLKETLGSYWERAVVEYSSLEHLCVVHENNNRFTWSELKVCMLFCIGRFS